MKRSTKVRTAARLMIHLEDLQHLGNFTHNEVRVLEEALLLLITQEQQITSVDQNISAFDRLLLSTPKIYELQLQYEGPTRILVYEPEQPKRRLQHVPIFAFSFGGTGLAALDTALAILADAFGEELSLSTFAEGKAQYCRYYRAFAKESVPRSIQQGGIGMVQIARFVQKEQRRSQKAPTGRSH